MWQRAASTRHEDQQSSGAPAPLIRILFRVLRWRRGGVCVSAEEPEETGQHGAQDCRSLTAALEQSGILGSGALLDRSRVDIGGTAGPEAVAQ